MSQNSDLSYLQLDHKISYFKLLFSSWFIRMTRLELSHDKVEQHIFISRRKLRYFIVINERSVSSLQFGRVYINDLGLGTWYQA
jgi:hypothetical protein